MLDEASEDEDSFIQVRGMPLAGRGRGGGVAAGQHTAQRRALPHAFARARSCSRPSGPATRC